MKGNSAFAFDLYQALRTDTDNLFYSPYSISLALATVLGLLLGLLAKETAAVVPVLLLATTVALGGRAVGGQRPHRPPPEPWPPPAWTGRPCPPGCA